LGPLRFRPILRRYLWGNRRLETLGKQLGPGSDYAESWEICDHGGDQSVVLAGPMAGATLGELVRGRAADLFGRGPSAGRFPLLVKFLDAALALSVQVHPNDAQAARLQPPDLGKTEAWIIVAADPGSVIYAGLRPGVTPEQLADALRRQTCQDLLHRFSPRPGDCVYLPAGTVHALGQGLVVFEVQQSSDVTFRLFDWNRLGPDGKPRPLHVAEGVAAVDFHRGPVNPQELHPTDRPWVSRLVTCEKFVLERWDFDRPQVLGGDGRFHVVCVLEGAVAIEGDPMAEPMPRGGTALLPASAGAVCLAPLGRTILADAFVD
jgi:mannose-6-phosphate isomerase